MTATMTRWLLLRTWLRGFALQASWNFERLQGLGALYVLAPALRRFYRGEALREALQRHLGYFNTHPFLAPAVLGATLNLEAAHSRGESPDVTSEDFSRMIMAPYAAMGDAFFWGGMRPLAAGVALFFAVRQSLWAPLVLLLVFNLPQLVCRWYGLTTGWREGLGVIPAFQRLGLPDLAIRVKETTVVLLGGLCAYLTYAELKDVSVSPLWGLLVLPLVALIGQLARRGASALLLVMGGVALIVVLVQLL